MRGRIAPPPAPAPRNPAANINRNLQEAAALMRPILPEAPPMADVQQMLHGKSAASAATISLARFAAASTRAKTFAGPSSSK